MVAVVPPRGIGLAVRLTKLRSLEITYKGGQCDPSEFLDTLSTPALTRFKVASIGPHGGPDCAAALAAFLSQSSALCELVIASRLWEFQSKRASDTLYELLKNTHKFKMFDIRWCRRETLSTDFLFLFGGSERFPCSTTPFLPVLTSLTLQDACGTEVDQVTLMNALRSRASQGLRDVTLLGQSSSWESELDGGGSSKPFEIGSTLNLQDENAIEQLRHLRDHIVNFRVPVDGRNDLW